jgi:MYXO-CTERM domain-containing protein
VTATQVWEDQYSGELGETDYHETLLVVVGEGLAAGGCAVAGGGASTNGAVALLALLGLALVRGLRRR